MAPNAYHTSLLFLLRFYGIAKPSNNISQIAATFSFSHSTVFANKILNDSNIKLDNCWNPPFQNWLRFEVNFLRKYFLYFYGKHNLQMLTNLLNFIYMNLKTKYYTNSEMKLFSGVNFKIVSYFFTAYSIQKILGFKNLKRGQKFGMVKLSWNMELL